MIRQVERGRQLDIHWRPQSAICRPCYVHYHFVGHYQSLLTDADHVLQHITTTTHDAAKFPRVDPDNQHHKRPSKELASVYYGLLDRALVSWLQTRLYSLDYRLFAFTPRNITDSNSTLTESRVKS